MGNKYGMRLPKKIEGMLKGEGRPSIDDLYGDPSALRDNCVVCGEWTENLNPDTRRCRRPECRKKLAERAVELGLAVKTGTTVIGRLDAAINYVPRSVPITKFVLPHKESDLCCICKTEVRRPKDDKCIACRLKANQKKYRK